MSKAQIREQINNSWDALERVMRSLSDEQLTTLKKDNWSVKDHLSHIALAERFVTAAINDEPMHKVLGIDKATLVRSSEDELNEIGYQRTKSLSVAQVMETRRKTHRQLLETVARLHEGDLEKPYAPYGQASGMTVLDILRCNTFEHYDLHRSWIEAMVTQPQVQIEK